MGPATTRSVSTVRLVAREDGASHSMKIFGCFIGSVCVLVVGFGFSCGFLWRRGDVGLRRASSLGSRLWEVVA